AVPAQPAEGEGLPRAPRHGRGDGPDRQARRERHDRQQRGERERQRADRRQRDERGPRRRRDEGPDRAEREKYYARPYGRGADGRDREPDPNSPFAKLAALKQRLEQGDKESP